MPGTENWYIHTSHRESIHYGAIASGVLRTRCGLALTPEASLFDRGDFPVAMVPMQDGQACRACATAAGLQIVDVEDPPPNRHRRGQMPGTSSWVHRQPGAALSASAAPPPLPAAAGQQHARSDDEPAQSRWFRRSTGPGDTHWVTFTARGSKSAICGAACGGKVVKDPAPSERCPICEAQRPRRGDG